MNQWNHLNKIEDRLVINLEFMNETPLHIGTSKSEYLSENINQILLVRQEDRIYGVIPETSLKGLLRNETIRVARTINDLKEIIEEHIKLIEKQETKTDEEEMKKHLKNCPICSIFGAQGLAGKIVIQAALTEKPLEIIHRQPTISINPKTRTTETGALSIHEAIPPNTKFTTRIIINNPTETEKQLITKVINNIENIGIQIGKRKTIGYGFIKIINKQIKQGV